MRAKAEVARARRERRGGGVFLELFAGAKRIAAQLRGLGAAVVTLEIADCPLQDACLAVVRSLLLAGIQQGFIGGAWLGAPCSSWGAARRGQPGRPGGPLRAAGCVWGHPDALRRPADRSRIEVGNATAKFSLAIISARTTKKVAVILENQLVTLDYCQNGATFRKRTRLQAWHAGDLSPLRRVCSGRRGLCSRTNRPHVVLEGTKMTCAAVAYPQ
ncbi:unnamed protein product, partial [Prorocentrum cordatum]